MSPSSSEQAASEQATAPPAQPAPQPSSERVNPLSAALTVAGIVAFAVWRPALAQQIAVFLLTLGVLVFVHEWGHYQFARWAGMKVNRFGLGFPPWVYTVRRNNIDYSLGALPIGGMVDIAGLGSEEEMVADVKGETVANPTRGRNPNAPFGQKQFQDASLGWRFWTLFAGPLMNFVFAMVVFIGLFSFVGVPIVDNSKIVILNVRDGMPAAKAGFQVDDVIVSVDSKPARSQEQLTREIRGSGGRDVQIVLQRGGQTIQKTLRPIVTQVNTIDGKGEEKAPIIGVDFGPLTTGYHRVGIIEASKQGWGQATFITSQIFGLLGRAATFKLTSEDKRGVGGPVKIAQAIGQSAQRGWMESVGMAAALSVNLGLLNLMPFPALDGGRILFLGYELVMRRPIDARKEGIVHAVGMVMLLAFMLLITVRDVVPFFQGLR